MKKSQKATNWRNRHVDQIAEKMMRETAVLLSKRLRGFLQMEDFAKDTENFELELPSV